MLRSALVLRDILYAEYCARFKGRGEVQVQPGHRKQVGMGHPGACP